MKKIIIGTALLLGIFTLSGCFDGDHGHGPDADHQHDAPDHHKSID